MSWLRSVCKGVVVSRAASASCLNVVYVCSPIALMRLLVDMAEIVNETSFWLVFGSCFSK